MILLNALTCALALAVDAATYQPKKGEEKCDVKFLPDEHRELGKRFYAALENVKTPDYAMFVRKYKSKCAYLVCSRCDHLGQLQSVGKDLWRNTWNDHCTKTWKQFWIGNCVCQLNLLQGNKCPKQDTDSEIERHKKLESDKKIFHSGQNDVTPKSQSAPGTNKYLGKIKGAVTKLNPFKHAEKPEPPSSQNHIGKESPKDTSKESSTNESILSLNNRNKISSGQPSARDPSIKEIPSDVRNQNQPSTDDLFQKVTPSAVRKHSLEPQEEAKEEPTAKLSLISGAKGFFSKRFQKNSAGQKNPIQDSQETRAPNLESKETSAIGNSYQPHGSSSTFMNNQEQSLGNQKLSNGNQPTIDNLFPKMHSSAIRKHSLEPKEEAKEEPKAKPSLISGAKDFFTKTFQKNSAGQKHPIQDSQETRNFDQPHPSSATTVEEHEPKKYAKTHVKSLVSKTKQRFSHFNPF